MLILLFTVIPMSVMAKEETVSNDNQTITDVTTIANCTYRTHVENIGWQDWKTNGKMSGTSGQGLRLEGIEVKLDNQGYDLGIEYSTHIQNIGWQEFKSNGVMSGTSGRGLRLEAIKISLTGNDSDLFDIYYRVHAQNVGWLDWASNGAESGTAGYGYRLEGIEIKIVPKGDPAPGATAKPFIEYETPAHEIAFNQAIGKWSRMISVSGYKPNKQIFNITKTGSLSAKVELIIMKSSGIDGEGTTFNVTAEPWKGEGTVKLVVDKNSIPDGPIKPNFDSLTIDCRPYGDNKIFILGNEYFAE